MIALDTDMLAVQRAEGLLTWNKSHFGSRRSFEVLTPEEYLGAALG